MSSVKPRREASPLPLKLFRMQWRASTKLAKQNNKKLANPILPIPYLILAFFLITIGHHQTITGSIPSLARIFHTGIEQRSGGGVRRLGTKSLSNMLCRICWPNGFTQRLWATKTSMITSNCAAIRCRPPPVASKIHCGLEFLWSLELGI